MGNISEIYRMRENVPQLMRPLFLSMVQAGFPSPADDYLDRILDLNELMIDHPSSTYFMRLAGDSMETNLHHGDMLVVDKHYSNDALHDEIVIASLDAGDMTVKRLYKQAGRVELRPDNPKYPPLVFLPHQEVRIWGVAMWTARQLSRRAGSRLCGV